MQSKIIAVNLWFAGLLLALDLRVYIKYLQWTTLYIEKHTITGKAYPNTKFVGSSPRNT